MNVKGNFDQKVCQILKRIDERILSHEIAVRELEHLKTMIPTLTSDFDISTSIQIGITPKKTAIANGKSLSPQAFADLNYDNYDVVFDCIERTLMARKDPEQHTELKPCCCTNIGKDRLKLLRYLMEHPKVFICEETLPYVYGDIASMSPNALAHAIRALRECLWNAPYIITINDWGESISHTGSVYLLNGEFKYLVIRWQI